jgi:hypothetical protein
MIILVATGSAVHRCDADRGTMTSATGLAEQRPTCLCADAGVPGSIASELVAADERGVHRSDDGGASWRQVAAYPSAPDHLRGLALPGIGLRSDRV